VVATKPQSIPRRAENRIARFPEFGVGAAIICCRPGFRAKTPTLRGWVGQPACVTLKPGTEKMPMEELKADVQTWSAATVARRPLELLGITHESLNKD
jgi:hypothetical protein